MSSYTIVNNKVSGGIVSTPGKNVVVWYNRDSASTFTINGSFNGVETPYDWSLLKETDTPWIKAGVISINASSKTIPVIFSSQFVNKDYYVFFLSSTNNRMFWSDKKTSGFIINGDFLSGSEISWIAIHRKIGQQTGINTPNSIFVGQRVINVGELMWNGTSFVPGSEINTNDILPLPADSTSEDDIPGPPGTYNTSYNLNGWYNNEYIIKPTPSIDGFSSKNMMNFEKSTDYSIIISSDTNINTFWIDKRSDRVKIGTSFPNTCTINFFIIRTGLNWWDQI